MVPARVLADPARLVALATMFTVASVIVGYVYFVTLYLQRVLGFSPLKAGLGLLPATLTVLVTSTWVTRRLAARFGARRVLVAGLVSIGLGQAWLSQLSASGSYEVNVLPGLELMGIGMGLLFPTAAVLATAGVAPGDRGLAGGLVAAAQQVGAAVGLAVLATVAAARTRAAPGPPSAALVAGYRLSYLIAVAIVACALLAVLLFLRPARPRPRAADADAHPQS
jgi:MFS family permease